MKNSITYCLVLYILASCAPKTEPVVKETEQEVVKEMLPTTLEAEKDPIVDTISTTYDKLLTSDAGAILNLDIDTSKEGGSPPLTGYLFPCSFSIDSIKGNTSTLFGSMSTCDMVTVSLGGANFNCWVYSLGIDPGTPPNTAPEVKKQNDNGNYKLKLNYPKSGSYSTQTFVIALPMGMNGKKNGTLTIEYALNQEKGKSKKIFNSSAGSAVPGPQE